MSTRKSARLTATKAAAVASTPAKHSEPQQRQQKRRKTANSVASGKKDDRIVVEQIRGHPQFLTETPLDVLLEVFSNLEPIDLLHLSRASKSLRNFLTSNNTAYIWKLAYENISPSSRPPECPKGVSLIHYTNYLYGRHCQFCASVHGRLYHDSALVRFCNKCIETQVSRDLEGPEALCNAWSFLRGRGRLILRVEYGRRQRELAKAKKRKTVAEYLKIRKDEVQARALHGQALDRWRCTLMYNISKRRGEQIYDKLKAEGHDKCQRSLLERVPHLRKVKELTDLEWQHIRADVIDFVQDDHEKKKAADMKRVLSIDVHCLSRFIQGPLNSPNPLIVPTAYYVASYETTLSFFQSHLPQSVPLADFEQFRPLLLEIVDTWRKEADEYLVNLILQSSSKKRKGKPDKGKETAVANPLELAATLFKCHWCTEPITYPRILAHRCLLRSTKDDEAKENKGMNNQEDETWATDDEDSEDIKPGAPREPRVPQEITVNTAWASLLETQSTGMKAGNTYVTFDEEAHSVACNTIQICGENPGTVTQSKMHEKNARLECLRCSRASQGRARSRLVMNWTMAILHDLNEHYGEDPRTEPVWKLVDSEDDILKVQDIESKMMKKWKTPSYYCKHCGHMLQSGCTSHLGYCHRLDIIESDVHKHFYMDFDAPMKKAPLPVKI